MAAVGEMLTFRFRLFDLDGDPADATVVGEVVNPVGVSTKVVFVRNSIGVYLGTFVCQEEGEHWVRAQSSGGITVPKEKKFMVAKQRVKMI